MIFSIHLIRCLLLILIWLVFFTVSAQKKLYDIQLENYNYPYPSHNIQLHNQGQDLEMSYIYEQPKKFNGKHVLLLHGKNFNGAYWSTTIAALTEQGYAVSGTRSDWLWQII